MKKRTTARLALLWVLVTGISVVACGDDDVKNFRKNSSAESGDATPGTGNQTGDKPTDSGNNNPGTPDTPTDSSGTPIKTSTLAWDGTASTGDETYDIVVTE